MIEPAEAGIGIFIQYGRLVIIGRVIAQHFFGDKIIHIAIGLVQPHAPQTRGLQIIIGQMVGDELRHHGRHFAKHFAAFLNKQLVIIIAIFGAVRLRKPKLLRILFENFVPNGIDNLKALLVFGNLRIFQDNRCRHITENENGCRGRGN